MSVAGRPAPTIEYPDSDGQPMAENTVQYRWIVTIKGGIDHLFHDDPNVFVAGDHFWYPVEGHPEIRLAPDVLVAFGRPKGDRGAYKQWEEGGIPPRVVFEVLSPGNRAAEMRAKLAFYERYGVEEYYIYDPDTNALTGRLRRSDRLEPIPAMEGWVSPRMNIRFDWDRATPLRILRPDGEPFLSYEEVAIDRDHQAHRADEAERRAGRAERKAERERRKAEAARSEAERLAAKLRELGIDPEAL